MDNKKNYKVATIISITIIVFISVIFLKNIDNIYNFLQKLQLRTGLQANLVCAVVGMVLGLTVEMYLKRTKEDSAYRSYLVKELDGIKKSDNDDEKKENIEYNNVFQKEKNKIIYYTYKKDKKDIIALMLKNNDEITEYFKISKHQAKSSFWVSIISCIVGLVILCSSIYLMIIIENIKYAIIGMVSGAITEVISGTVLRVNNKSALQLNHYYDALHENEKLLAAINMADKLSDEKREEMYIEIIRKQIN